MKQIPVRETVTAAYAYTFGNIGKLVGLVWLPALLTFAGSYLFVRPYLFLAASNPSPDELMQHGQLMFGVYAFYFFAVVFSGMMAAGIAKDVLTPDTDPGVFHFPGFRAVMRTAGGLFGLLLLISLVSGVVEVLAMKAGSMIPAVAVYAILVVVALAILYAALRLIFFQVPAACEGHGFGLIRSWELTKGHFRPVLLIALCCALPVIIVSFLAQFAILGPQYFTISDPSRMVMMADRFWLISGVNFFLTPFAYGLYVAPTALVYRRLTHPEAPEGEDAVDEKDKAGNTKTDATDASETDEKE